jgi:hypothetical protein
MLLVKESKLRAVSIRVGWPTDHQRSHLLRHHSKTKTPQQSSSTRAFFFQAIYLQNSISFVLIFDKILSFTIIFLNHISIINRISNNIVAPMLCLSSPLPLADVFQRLSRTREV